MPAPATLTGQDVGEAEGALTALLNQVLSNTDITRTQYITLRVLALRVLALRGPAPSPAELHDYLASQHSWGSIAPRSPSSCTASKPRAWSLAAPPMAPGPPSSPPRAPPSTPGWSRPSAPSPDACMPTLTQTTLPPPTGCWSRSPNALGASVTNPDGPIARPRQPGHTPMGRP